MTASLDPRAGESPPGAAVIARLRQAGCVFAEEEAALLLEAAAGQPDRLERLVAARAAHVRGLLDDDAPSLPEQGGDLVPDSLVAILTVRDGDAIRRVVVPAGEPSGGSDLLGDEAADVPLSTPMQLRSSSVDALQPVLEALRAVEAAL